MCAYATENGEAYTHYFKKTRDFMFYSCQLQIYFDFGYACKCLVNCEKP